MKSSAWSLHCYSPLGFVVVLIWSGLNIKLQKIRANKFCDMTFCSRCLHFKPLNIYKHIPLFSLPRIKKEKANTHISGCTTKLGWKLFPLLACLEYCLFCLEEPWWCVYQDMAHHDTKPFPGVSYNCRETWWKIDFSLQHSQHRLKNQAQYFWKLRGVQGLPD